MKDNEFLARRFFLLSMANSENCYNMKPIAHVRSPFLFKNGTPRQPTVCQQARGIITIEKSVFNNPEHSLEGMHDFTHVWILFIFHENNNAYSKAKVKPPRLNGKRVGLFSTRSPYRPNNVGLTLAKIENISGATLTVSGIDMIDGTPVIDIKPYIQQYDYPSAQTLETIPNNQLSYETGLNNKTICDDQIDCNVMPCDDNDKGYENKMGYTTTNAVESDIDEKHVDSIECDNDVKHVVSIECDNAVKHVVSIECDNAVKHVVTVECDNGVKNVDSLKSDNGVKPVDIVESNVKPKLDTKDMIAETLALETDSNYTKLNKNIHSNNIEMGRQLKSEVDALALEDTSSSSKKTIFSINERASLDSTDEFSSSKIPVYESSNCSRSINGQDSKSAEWIEKPPIQQLDVRFTPTASKQLEKFSFDVLENNPFKLNFFENLEAARGAICNILHEDPRSTYRRKHCVNNLYYFTIDVLHITCWFDENVAEVVRIKPASLVEQCKQRY